MVGRKRVGGTIQPFRLCALSDPVQCRRRDLRKQTSSTLFLSSFLPLRTFCQERLHCLPDPALRVGTLELKPGLSKRCPSLCSLVGQGLWVEVKIFRNGLIQEIGFRRSTRGPNVIPHQNNKTDVLTPIGLCPGSPPRLVSKLVQRGEGGVINYKSQNSWV